MGGKGNGEVTLELEPFLLKTPSSPCPLPKAGEDGRLHHYNTCSSCLPWSTLWAAHFAATIGLSPRGTAHHLCPLSTSGIPHTSCLLSPTSSLSLMSLHSAPTRGTCMPSPHSTLSPSRSRGRGCTTALSHSPYSLYSPFPHGSSTPAPDSL